MNFKDYLKEFYYPPVESESTENYISSEVSQVINGHFSAELENTVLSPETGFQSIRKVLHRSGWEMPALYELDPDGDEIVYEIHPMADTDTCAYLYVLYYLTDNGDYEFYAEVGDENRMKELTSDEGEEEPY